MFEDRAFSPQLAHQLATDKSWSALYHAVLAIGSQYHNRGGFEPGKSQAWKYFEITFSLCPDLLIFKASLTTVQALTAMLESITVSQAARMAQSLGYNRATASSDKSIQRTFWVLYCMEKTTCFYTGKTSVRPFLHDSPARASVLTSPSKSQLLSDHDIGFAPPSLPEPAFGGFDWLVTFSRYGRLVSRIYANLFAINAAGKPAAAYYSIIDELRGELEGWRDAIPERFRPGGAFRVRDYSGPPATTLAIFVQYLYFSVLLALSRGTLHVAKTNEEQGTRHQEAKKELMQTARRILELSRHIEVEPFSHVWVLVFMPLSALFILFDFVVHNPVHPETNNNLALLDIAGGHFSHLEYVSQGTLPASLAAEFAHIARQYVQDFRMQQYQRMKGLAMPPAADPSIGASHPTPATTAMPTPPRSVGEDLWRLTGVMRASEHPQSNETVMPQTNQNPGDGSAPSYPGLEYTDPLVFSLGDDDVSAPTDSELGIDIMDLFDVELSDIWSLSYPSIKNGPLPADGAGSDSFSNTLLISLLIVVPLFIARGSLLGTLTYGLMTAIPILATYWYTVSKYSPRKNVKATFPGRGVEHYLHFHKASDRAKYQGQAKIPLETFHEIYFAGDVDLKGDMLDILEYRHDWASFRFTLSLFKFFLTGMMPEVILHTRSQDEEQVRGHYDRGNDFYAWFLGPRMIYTSGIISDPNREETLEELQDNKLAIVCEKIQLQRGEQVLDMGCGWGTFATFASAKYGACVTGITLGRNQTAWGNNLLREAGIAETQSRILCMDYRDVPRPADGGRYKKIVCLEMCEHVGIRNFSSFLRLLHDLLDDDGVLILQYSGLRKYWQYEDLIWGLFMNKYVFPGADASTPLGFVVDRLEGVGFEVKHVDTIGVHYSGTLWRWYRNWISNREKVEAKYGKRWYRIWEFFLASSTITSRQGGATCFQITLVKNINSTHRIDGVGVSTPVNDPPGSYSDPQDILLSSPDHRGDISSFRTTSAPHWNEASAASTKRIQPPPPESNNTLQHATTPRPLLHPRPPPFLNPNPLPPRDTVLVHHWVTFVCANSVLVDSATNFFRTIYTPLAVQHPSSSRTGSSSSAPQAAVYHALCAAAAYSRARVCPLSASSSSSSASSSSATDDETTTATRHETAAVRLLQHSLDPAAATTTTTTQKEAVLAAIILLTLVDIIRGTTAGAWRAHMRGGKSWIEALGGAAGWEEGRKNDVDGGGGSSTLASSVLYQQFRGGAVVASLQDSEGADDYSPDGGGDGVVGGEAAYHLDLLYGVPKDMFEVLVRLRKVCAAPGGMTEEEKEAFEMRLYLSVPSLDAFPVHRFEEG
ncbi:Sphingolipid C9-methyltransferase 2 [Lasiodiplodia theobromae]|uniref:sphingolipid C(9)-methyltransferase n=1 Tax=Lasiodiplodia theobromae TaxID=45133 RepID=A0A5N5DAS3_9PEZI|nr:Sphingolipid C9-methyltransferase 2 [Lasiodiplodia theobromae]